MLVCSLPCALLLDHVGDARSVGRMLAVAAAMGKTLESCNVYVEDVQNQFHPYVLLVGGCPAVWGCLLTCRAADEGRQPGTAHRTSCSLWPFMHTGVKCEFRQFILAEHGVKVFCFQLMLFAQCSARLLFPFVLVPGKRSACDGGLAHGVFQLGFGTM